MGDAGIVRVAFRTEGNHKQGMGDVFGSIALAEQFRNDETLFIISGGTAAEVLEVRGYRFKIVSSFHSELATLAAFDPDIIVINKLDNEIEYVSGLKQHLRALIVTVDDS